MYACAGLANYLHNMRRELVCTIRMFVVLRRNSNLHNIIINLPYKCEYPHEIGEGRLHFELNYIARSTLPERRQRVQMSTFLTVPPTRIWVDWMFGAHDLFALR